MTQEETAVAAQAAALIYHYIEVTALFGGLGGFVHGISRQTPVHYAIAWPLQVIDTKESKPKREFGFLGDIFIGIASAIAVFFVMDTLFGLSAPELGKGAQQYLKFVALGVIGGYAGTLILDNLSIFVSKRLSEQ